MPIPEKTDWLIQDLLHPVTLFADLNTFEQALERCRRHGYEVRVIDCHEFQTQDEVCNAVLHAVDVLRPEYWYNRMNLDQFSDLLLTPGANQSSGRVIAFRHYDRFFHSDPRSARIVLRLLAEQHAYALQGDEHFLIVAHSEDQSLSQEPVLKVEARRIQCPDFSPQADIDQAKVELYSAWYKQVAREYEARSGKAITPTDVQRAWHQSLGGITLNLYPENPPDIDEGIRLVDANEIIKEERWRQRPGYAQTGWLESVVEALQKRSPDLEPTREMVVSILDILQKEQGQVLNHETASAEAAVEILLQQEPEMWERTERKWFSLVIDRNGTRT
ncbi:hypothetical protein EON80_09820, partial [bacterium]